ncbi:MAG TPA: NUDIX domain-containing protein [Candidatus Limiplasma sp.]|nr:NUDIX domain-containing protein [Candidatus Limiplasma sp.]HRX09522.1 NUDIX domain-containing protein [Candidatus Limiplasma sp.]
MRQPQNIHVYPYRKNSEGLYEYAVFRRADDPKCWQGISGGVESGETAEQAARREAYEEAGIAQSVPLYRLDSISFLSADLFAEHRVWGPDVVVCPMYFFAMPYNGPIVLSAEHTQMCWAEYQSAFALVYWHDQKNALWELNQRLLRGNLIR